MISFIKFILHFLLNVITTNPFKIIYILVFSISLNYIDSFENPKYNVNILKELSEFNTSSDRYYIIRDDDNNISIRHNLNENGNFDKVYHSNGHDFLIEEGLSASNIVIGSLVGLSGLILIITLLQSIDDYDGEFSWCFSDSIKFASKNMIECFFEEGKYYYIIFGRLIHIDEFQKKVCLSLNDLMSMKQYPKFKTKTQKRESLINNLGL